GAGHLRDLHRADQGPVRSREGSGRSGANGGAAAGGGDGLVRGGGGGGYPGDV
ncbi:MAG: Nucleoside ABC transporter, periplasmic nucleoside-binding protein, partial [uncultured Thermomicrobiales bacterium]